MIRGKPAGAVSPVGQGRSGCAPAIFENAQARVLPFATSQVELRKVLFLGFLNRSPQQQLDAAQTVVSLVRASVFVHQLVLVAERENASDRPPVCRGHTNLNVVAQDLAQILEPRFRLGRQSMATAGS